MAISFVLWSQVTLSIQVTTSPFVTVNHLIRFNHLFQPVDNFLEPYFVSWNIPPLPYSFQILAVIISRLCLWACFVILLKYPVLQSFFQGSGHLPQVLTGTVLKACGMGMTLITEYQHSLSWESSFNFNLSPSLAGLCQGEPHTLVGSVSSEWNKISSWLPGLKFWNIRPSKDRSGQYDFANGSGAVRFSGPAVCHKDPFFIPGWPAQLQN